MSHPFIPRDWQERFVEEYQANPQKNTLVEGCTASGKTGGALYTFSSLRTTLDWKFVVAVTPSEHLRKQYAQDAHHLFSLVLYYSGTDNRLKGLPNPEDLLKQSYDGLVVSYQWLANGRNAQNLADALGKSGKGRVFVILDEVHHSGEGVSINRLKYRIHATNICAPLSFIQDLGRLLRLFPSQDSPEAVETLIPAHPTLIQLATDVLNEVAHVVNETGEIDDKNGDSKGKGIGESEGESDTHHQPLILFLLLLQGKWERKLLKARKLHQNMPMLLNGSLKMILSLRIGIKHQHIWHTDL